MGAFTLPTPPFETTLENLQPMQPNYSLLPESTSMDLMNPDSALNNPLNALPPPDYPNVTVNNSTPANEIPGTWQNTLSNLVNKGVGYNPDNPGLLGSFVKLTLEDGVFIVLGLLLIAAGVFSFKQTQTVIREGGRAAVTAAAAAA